MMKSAKMFDGANVLELKRQAQAVISSTRPSNSEIPSGKTRPTAINGTICRRSTTGSSPVVTRSRVRDVTSEEDESSGRVINEDGIVLCDRANEQLFGMLYLTTTGPVNSYLLRFEPRGSTTPDDEKAWDGLIAKYQNSSQQRRRILMRQLDDLTMS